MGSTGCPLMLQRMVMLSGQPVAGPRRPVPALPPELLLMHVVLVVVQ
jgi:hypothetical protein